MYISVRLFFTTKTLKIIYFGFNEIKLNGYLPVNDDKHLHYEHIREMIEIMAYMILIGHRDKNEKREKCTQMY